MKIRQHHLVLSLMAMTLLLSAATWVAAATPATTPAGTPTARTQTDRAVGLANGSVALSFSRQTGALVSLKNLRTNDEYLKGPENDGNPFRVYLDTTDDMPPAAKAGDPFRVTPVEDAMGGKTIDAKDCRLVKSAFNREGAAGVLSLVLAHPDSKLEFMLTVTLPDDDVVAQCALEIGNAGSKAHRVMTAMPYLTGISLGPDRASNKGVKVRQWGMTNLPAWSDTGWPYPIWNMRWNAVYDYGADEGLGVIVADGKAQPGRIFRRFAPSGMSVLHYPAPMLAPRQRIKLPTAKILVHQGDWRFVGRKYRDELDEDFTQRMAPEWLKQISVLGSCPNFAAVAQGPGDTGRTPPSFEDSAAHLLSWPYEAGGCAGWPQAIKGGEFPTYTGDYAVRADMGGAESLKKAIEKAHAADQRVLLNIAFHTIHRDAQFLRGKNPADYWVQPGPKAEFDQSPEKKNFFACMGYKPWQDQLISVCTRLLKETGADGFYLDEGGGVYWPCFNPAHHHKSPYNVGEKLWGVKFHQRLRQAMDQVNPQTMLITENVNESLLPYLDGAHSGETPTRDFPPFAFVFPRFRSAGYAPVIPAMLSDMNAGDGAAAMSDLRPPPNAIAYHEQIQGKGGFAPTTMGFEGKDPAMIKSLTPTNLRWAELRTTFQEALDAGDSTLHDPVAEVDNPSDYVARLWRGPRYWLLNAGHFAGWPLSQPVRFRLPELPENITEAYEIDLTNFNAEPTQLAREPGGIYVTIHHGFSAVLLPTSDCPPLMLVPPVEPCNIGKQIDIPLRALAPWRKDSAPIRVNMAIPGVFPAKTLELPITIQAQPPADAVRGFHFLRISGDCLPLKRNFLVR